MKLLENKNNQDKVKEKKRKRGIVVLVFAPQDYYVLKQELRSK